MTYVPLQLPRVIAHRGAPQVAPENTLSSLRRAKALGATWTEFDVRLTQDNHGIIFHDDTLERTTNGQGLVVKSTLKQILQLDAGSWFNPTFHQECVPTFQQYVQTAVELQLGINIELKGTDFPPDLLAEQVVNVLANCWRTELPTPLISSLAVTNLRAMRKQGDHYLLGFITDVWVENWREILQSFHCISLHVNYKVLTPARINAVKKNNYLLLAYTVDDKKIAEDLFALGVDAVFSNNPQLLSS